MNSTDADNAAYTALCNTFDQGFISALVSLYGQFPACKDEVLHVLRFNGFRTFEKALSVHPDEYEASILKLIYGVDEDD